MKCLACVNLNTQDHPRHANLGMGRCKADLPGVFVYIGRNEKCGNFKQAAIEVVLKREAWVQGSATSQRLMAD